MNLDIFEKIANEIQNNFKKNVDEKKIENIHNENINTEELELAQKLNAIDEFTLDRFEGNIAVLEDRNTRKTKNIDKNKIPKYTKEGDILKCINGKYYLDKERTKEIELDIQNKYKNLWE